MAAAMPEQIETLTLCHAPQANAEKSKTEFFNFLDKYYDPHVRRRSEDIVREAIGDGGLYFVRRTDGEIVACSGFYRHGVWPVMWGEVGSTLVAPKYRGAGMQRIIYHHTLALNYVGDWPENDTIAVVDETAPDSYTNIERCGFELLTPVPKGLEAAAAERDWSKIHNKEKRVYRLTDCGMGRALDFVADNGAEHYLLNKAGDRRYKLKVEFEYLKYPGMITTCKAIADRLMQSCKDKAP
jgi:hypothetical protein